MDKCEEEIDRLTKNNTNISKLNLWLDIFNSSDILGKRLSTQRQIRGRAGEKMMEAVCSEISEKMSKVSTAGLHSFHYGGTELDFLFITPYVFFPIECKAMKNSKSSHVRNVIMDATSQNMMHIQRLEKFLGTSFYKSESVPVKITPIIVHVNDGAPGNTMSEVNYHKVAHIRNLANVMINVILKSYKSGYVVPEYEKLYAFLTKYYNSTEHQARIQEKKKIGGYV